MPITGMKYEVLIWGGALRVVVLEVFGTAVCVQYLNTGLTEWLTVDGFQALAPRGVN